MKVTTCALDIAYDFQISAGVEIQLSITSDEELLAIWDNNKSSVLVDAIDWSQQLDKPSVYIVHSNHRKEVLLLGGTKAYYLIGQSAQFAFDLPRCFGDLAEYANVVFQKTTRGLLCIFETGLILIDQNLQRIWSTEKYVNDFFLRLDADEIVMRYDHEDEWRLSLEDGSRLKGQQS